MKNKKETWQCNACRTGDPCRMTVVTCTTPTFCPFDNKTDALWEMVNAILAIDVNETTDDDVPKWKYHAENYHENIHATVGLVNDYHPERDIVSINKMDDFVIVVWREKIK